MSERSAESGGLGRRAVRGAAVTSAGQGLRILIQLASVVIMARLLSPADVGLFAMVMSVAGIAEVFRDFGLSQAAVQAPVLTTRQRDNLFWINSAMGAALAVAVFLSSWGIAALYGVEELAPLAQLASVAFLLNGLATQFRASLNRSLRFTALSTTDVTAALVGLGVGVGVALAGVGPWALVAQLLGAAFATLVLVAVFAAGCPGCRAGGFPSGGFIRFGWNMVATQMVTYVGNNVDTVVIGVRFGASQLGIYNRAFHLVMNTANQLRAPITNVAVPVLSRLQGEGARYWDFVRVGQVGLGYTIVVVLAFVIGAAVPVTALLLGPRWAEVAPVLSLLAVAAVFQTLNSASLLGVHLEGHHGPALPVQPRERDDQDRLHPDRLAVGDDRRRGRLRDRAGPVLADLAPLDLAGDRRRADPDTRVGHRADVAPRRMGRPRRLRRRRAHGAVGSLGPGSRCRARDGRRLCRSRRCSRSSAGISANCGRCCACCGGSVGGRATADAAPAGFSATSVRGAASRPSTAGTRSGIVG